MRSIFKQSRLFPALAALLGLVLAGGCGVSGDNSPAAPGATAPTHAHEHGPHGGTLVEVGDGENSHLEFLHQAKAGCIDVFFLGADGKTPAAVKGPVYLNLKAKGGPIQVEAAEVVGEIGVFFCEHAAFKAGHLHGQIVFSLGGKEFFLPFPEACEGEAAAAHEHGPDCAHEHEDLRVIPGADGEQEHGAEHAHHDHALVTTQWTGEHEWFVELAVPEKRVAVGFAVHLTRLTDFQPLTAGSLRVRANLGEQEVVTVAAAPGRPGIFTPKITFPTVGDWTLQLTYKHGDMTDQITWVVKVCTHADLHAAEHPAEATVPKGIVFRKEKQWQVPFATMRVGRDLVIPAGALITDQGKSFVFVQLAGEFFSKREVQAAPAGAGRLRIKTGLAAGEHIVRKGVDQLKK